MQMTLTEDDELDKSETAEFRPILEGIEWTDYVSMDNVDILSRSETSLQVCESESDGIQADAVAKVIYVTTALQLLVTLKALPLS